MELHRAVATAMRSLRCAPLRALVGAVACAGALTLWSPAKAQEFASEPTPVATVQAPLDMAVGLHADGPPIGKVVVSQPETAQVGPAGSERLYVIGSQPGTTNLLVYDRQGRLSQSLDVQVGPDAQALREVLAEALPGEAITVKGSPSSLLLEGEVSSPSVLAIAERLAERLAPDAVISRLHARSNQVRLDVKFLEVSNVSLREIDTALSVTNGAELAVSVGGPALGIDTAHGVAAVSVDAGRLRLDAAVRALESRGELRIVAEPSLVARSGETAKFRAGGEFPFPMPNDGKVTIEFRPYGAGMTFQPIVQENGLIRVSLEAELSEVDPSVGLRLANFNVPGLKVRRATTAVELRDGESFVIAGLFEDSSERLAREPPFLSRIPVIGPVLQPLLQSTRKKDTRRELAIIVTPRIGGQVSSPVDDRALLAEAHPPQGPLIDAPRTPKSASAPRGPPLRALVAEVRDVLRPPIRWVAHAASRVTSALLGRA
jgi:pilus assembly protein CpaC